MTAEAVVTRCADVARSWFRSPAASVTASGCEWRGCGEEGAQVCSGGERGVVPPEGGDSAVRVIAGASDHEPVEPVQEGASADAGALHLDRLQVVPGCQLVSEVLVPERPV